MLTRVGGIAWTVVYVEAIRVGLRDRTCAMPVAALALNFAWEPTYIGLPLRDRAASAAGRGPVRTLPAPSR